MPTCETFERYSRQIILPEIGEEGQQRLGNASVLIVGAGGLGSAAGLYLAAAGVGRLGIMDPEDVETSNLQRQILHGSPDLGRAKVESARESLQRINPDLAVRLHPERLTRANAEATLAGYAFVIDATDNFDSKFLLADVCHLGGVPYVHAGVAAFQGLILTVLPGKTACYRCVFEAPPSPRAVPACEQGGILGTVAGLVGTIQATEAIKCIVGCGALLTDRLLTVDALSMTFRDVAVARNVDCPLCGSNPTITKLED